MPEAHVAAQAKAEYDDLLRMATARGPGRCVVVDAPGKSGARLEQIEANDERFVVKYLDRADDWTLRASGWLASPVLPLWERGILARLPDCINQPIVAVAELEGTLPGRSGGCALLMRDVSAWLVPATDEPIGTDQHLRFLRHMAEVHAAFWEGGAELEVVPAMHRYLELSPWMAEAEAAIGSEHLVPQLVAKGWPLFAEVAPTAAAIVAPLSRDPSPLVIAMARTPQTLVHSKLETGQPRHRRRWPYGAAGLGTAGPRGGAQRPGLVPGDQLPATAAVQGGQHRGLPDRARRAGNRDRALVGSPARPGSARRACAIRLGKGARRIRRGACMVGGPGGAGGAAAGLIDPQTALA